MRVDCDVAVAGAGPAGSCAARVAAAAGLRVVVCERANVPGTPVRCGEAVGAEALRECTEVDPAWVSETISGVTMVSPSGIRVHVDRMAEGYILRRDLMDRHLAERAAAAGAELRTAATLVEVRREDGRFECRDHRGRALSASCVVLADGVESRLAHMLGWDTALSLEDLSSCAFGRVTHESVPVHDLEMHYGSGVAVGGYAWVFPRGDGSANVGLGVLGSRSRGGMARESLVSFVNKRFCGAPVTEVHAGGVPVGRWVRPLARGGAVLVGDAARQVDALSGGGITHAMNAGTWAGEAVVAAHRTGSFCPAVLGSYEKRWARGPGRQLMRTYALKQMVIGLGDSVLDDIAQRLSLRKPGGMGLLSVCIAAFARRPTLLLKALMVFR